MARSIGSWVPRWAKLAAPAAAALVVIGGIGVAEAASRTTAAATPHAAARGVNEFGMTMGDIKGGKSQFTYSKGYFCDTTVHSYATTGCEVGQKYNHAPARSFDPLFITVPLGFTPASSMPMDCPSRLTCVDHPGTMDLTRLAAALAPIFKTTPAKLAPALRNFGTPGHDHFILDKNNGKAEWWDVYVIGVTNKALYKSIQVHGSYKYIQGLVAAHNKNLTPAIPTNLFLFFAAK